MGLTTCESSEKEDRGGQRKGRAATNEVYMGPCFDERGRNTRLTGYQHRAAISRRIPKRCDFATFVFSMIRLPSLRVGAAAAAAAAPEEI